MPEVDKIVEVPGVGNVAFPGDMADWDISEVIKGQIQKLLTTEELQKIVAPKAAPQGAGVFSGGGLMAPNESAPHAITRQALGGVGRGIKAIPESAAGLVSPPETPLEIGVAVGGGKPALAATRFVREASPWGHGAEQEADVARQRFKEGRPISGTIHAALSGVPFGSWLGNALTGAEEGDVGAATQFGTEYAAFSRLPKIGKKVIETGGKILRPPTQAELVTKGLKKIGEGVGVPYSDTAVAASERLRTLAPKGASREILDAVRDLQEAKGDLAEIDRQMPLKGVRGPEGTLARANKIVRYMDRLWEKSHKDPIHRRANVPIDNEAILNELAFSEEAIRNAPTEAKAATEWTQRVFLRRLTVASADELMREINADLNTAGAEQAYGPLLLRTKRLAASLLREQLDVALEKSGEVGVKAANRRWGALRTVAQHMTESGLAEAEKAGNASLMQQGIHTYGYLNPRTVLPHGGLAVNPGRLFARSPSSKIAKGMNMLGESGIEPIIPPPAPPGGPSPPPMLPAAPIPAPVRQPSTPTGGVAPTETAPPATPGPEVPPTPAPVTEAAPAPGLKVNASVRARNAAIIQLSGKQKLTAEGQAWAQKRYPDLDLDTEAGQGAALRRLTAEKKAFERGEEATSPKAPSEALDPYNLPRRDVGVAPEPQRAPEAPGTPPPEAPAAAIELPRPAAGETVRRIGKDVWTRLDAQAAIKKEFPWLQEAIVGRTEDAQKLYTIKVTNPDEGPNLVGYGTDWDIAAADLARQVRKTRRGQFESGEYNREVYEREKAQTPPSAAPSLAESKPLELTKPTEVRRIPVSEINVDAQQFQFKRDVGKGGVSESLKDVKVWNENLAGTIQVWHDPKTISPEFPKGKLFVINGHHRLDLAKRLGVKDINAMEIKAETAREARIIGALTNIAEGRGTAIDAAKLFRETGFPAQDLPAELARQGVSLREKQVIEGQALANLSEPIWNQIWKGELKPSIGVAIGESISSPEAQAAALKMVRGLESRNKHLGDAELRDLIRIVQSSGESVEVQTNLFGLQEITRSHALEQAQLMSWVRQTLGRDKRLFGTVSRGAGRIEEAGIGKVSAEEAAALSKSAAQVQEVFDKLALTEGEIHQSLKASARQVAEGGNAVTIRQELYGKVREAVRKIIGGRGTSDAQGIGPNP